MIVNLYEPRDDWFLQYMADAIKKYADTSVKVRSIYFRDRAVYPDGVNFFCNMGIYNTYLLATRQRPAVRDIVMTTHIESWRPWNLRTQWLYRQPVTLIAFCRWWYDFFVERGIRPAAIAIPGVDDEFFAVQPFRPRRDKKVVALIGRRQRSGRKGERWLLPLLQRVGNDFSWMIIGFDWDRFLASSLLKPYGIIYRQRPERQLYYDLFKEIDIFLSLSSIEGGPMPLIESMAAGVIPVVSDTGFAREVIDDGRNGFVYPVGDIDRASGILRELKDRDLNDVRRAAQEGARPYTWKNFADTVIKVMRSVDASR